MNEDTRPELRHKLRDLIEEMRASPQYLSGDDDLTTPDGIITTAIAFIGRMRDDFQTLTERTTLP